MNSNTLTPLLFIGVLFATLTSLNSQSLDHIQGEIIVCFHESPAENSPAFTPDINSHDCLSDHMKVWQLNFDHAKVDINALMESLARQENVAAVQKNHLLKRRSFPNDPGLAEQWWIINDGTAGLLDADIDLDEAWAISTGGVTAYGDTIVVAVLDNGIDDSHPDLIDNLWVNEGEISNNGIDDDGNGYVDDRRGWNVNLDNDDISPELQAGGVMDTHGTEICGIIGASTNNNLGVAGMNWDIKIMSVNINTELTEADMIAAYAYVLDQRVLYNETNGEQGAYVVATNLSYGDEDLSPEDSPIWCGIYDTLGQNGILNVTATANRALNIDEIKDVPGSCSSDHMMAVTATNINDERTFAAFGVNDIDLAAPGREIYTTSIPDYDGATGASFAAPMVVGTIALLYSSPCGDLAALSKVDPAAASTMARALIEENVDSIATLIDDVATGGRLNTARAMIALLENCQTCVAPFDIDVAASDTEVSIEFMTVDSVTSTQLLWRKSGDTTFTTIDSVVSPILLENLTACTSFEYALINNCAEGADTTEVQLVSTACCAAPSNLLVEDREVGSVVLAWDSLGVDLIYEVRYQVVGDSTWLTSTATSHRLVLDSLSDCTTYAAQIRTICTMDTSEYGDTLQFLTSGCGTCLDSVYCSPSVMLGGDYFIDSIALHTLTNQSGPDAGYGDFAGIATTQLKQGSQYQLAIHPGSSGEFIGRRYFAWIDYDQSGSFEPDRELIASNDSSSIDPFSTLIRVPVSADLGPTRLRIASIADTSTTLINFDPCIDTIFNGEMEDYCIEIIFDSLLCEQTPLVDTILVDETSAEVMWERVDSSISYTFRWRELDSEEWMDMTDTTNTFMISDLEECKTYEFQVNTVCAFDTSGYTESLIFSTTCMMVSTANVNIEPEVSVFPNPFTNVLNVDVQHSASRSLRLTLHSLDGRMMLDPIITDIQQGVVPMQGLSGLPPGLYFLAIEGENSRQIHKLIKS